MTSKSGQVTRHCQYTFGVSSARCESLQITAPPCAVRAPADRPRVRPGLDLGEEPQVPFDVAERLVEQASATGPGQPSVGRHRDRRSRGPASPAAEGAGPTRRQQHRVRELVLPLPHLDVPDQERRDGVPGLPRLDRGTARGSGARAIRDGLVDPARVGLERRPQRRGDIAATSSWAAAASPSRRARTSAPSARRTRRPRPTARTPAAGRSPSGTAGPARTRTPCRPTRRRPSRARTCGTPYASRVIRKSTNQVSRTGAGSRLPGSRGSCLRS